MAGNNHGESPRQKMINLMYLVLLAMLALNVSSDVLKGFSLVDESLNRSTANATMQNQAIYHDFADYMTKKGVPFRDAYCVTGQLVNRCIELNTTLDQLPIEEYRAYSPVFDTDVYAAIDLLTCVSQRKIPGGPAPETVKKQIEWVLQQI